MSRSHGRLAVLFIDDAADACQQVTGDITSITFNRSKTTPESTTLGDSTVQRETDAIRDATLDMTALYSTGAGACVTDLLEGMYSGSDYRRVQYAPGGSVTGCPLFTACMQLNNYSVTTPVDGISTVSAGLENAVGNVASSILS